MVDNQNQNARYIDKFGQGTSSVRLHAPPGGKSQISLGWDDSTPNDYKKNDSYNVYNNNNSNTNLRYKNNQSSYNIIGGTDNFSSSTNTNSNMKGNFKSLSKNTDYEYKNTNNYNNDYNVKSMNNVGYKNNNNVQSNNNIGLHQGSEKTSVRVKHAPGGESSIKFG